MRCRGAVVAFVVLAQLGGGLGSGVGGTRSSSGSLGSMLPGNKPSLPGAAPSVPPVTAPSVTGNQGAGDQVWVPSRIVPVPGESGGLVVPGHWERQISPHETYMPPLTGITPDGRVFVIPGGVVRTPEERQSP